MAAELGNILIKIGATVATLQADMAKATGVMTRSERAFKNASKNISSALKGALSIAAVVGFTKAMGSLISEGDKLGDLAENFSKLGGTQGSLEAARASTQGLVTDMQLLEAANIGLVKIGPKVNQQFSKIAEAGAKIAQALGRDTSETITGLMNAIAKGSQGALKKFGVLVDKGATFETIMAQLEKRSTQLAPVTIGVSEATAQLAVAWTNLNTQIGVMLNNSSSTIAVLKTLTGLVNSFARGLDYLTESSDISKIVNLKKEIADLQQDVKMVDESWKPVPIIQRLFGFDDNTRNKLNAQIAEKQKQIEDLMAGIKKSANEVQTTIEIVGPGIVGEVEKAAPKAAKIIKEETIEPVKDETEKALMEAFETSANFFSDVFLSAMEGTMPDLENIFKQIASGFAGAIASAVTGINFGGNFQQLGISLGAQALGIGGTAGGAGLGAGLLSGGAGLLGSAGFSMSGGAAAAAGISGPANAAGMFVQPGSGVLGAVGPAMPYVAAALAVYAGLEHFGVFDNKKHPETQARKDVINYLESKLGKDFVLGDSGKFNNGKGFEFLNGLDDKAKNTFTAMGEGLTRFLGITEDVGPQIGAILAENFTGNLDEAKMMLGQLGISMEDMTNSVIEFGLQADQSLLQIQQNVAGIEEAFKPGKAAIGDWAGAFEDFTKSGNKGIKATTAIKNVAIESIEAGMTKIEQLKPKLEALFPREQVEKFFQAMSAFGITDLQQLADASDRTLIAVGAHIEALGFQFDKLVDSVKQTVAEINKLSAATSRIDVPTTTPVGGIPQMARGGIFSKATLGIFGEAGPEAILPLTRVGGVLGVRSVGGGGGQVVFQIDARGAAPGVENTIMNAIKQAKDEAINTAVRAVQGMRTSNPSYGRIFDE